MGEIQTYQDLRLQSQDEREDAPADFFEECAHKLACRRQLIRCGLWYEEEEEIPKWVDKMAKALGCGEDCEECDLA